MRVPCQAVIREPQRATKTQREVSSKREQRSESNVSTMRIMRFKMCLINCLIDFGGIFFRKALLSLRENLSSFILILCSPLWQHHATADG